MDPLRHSFKHTIATCRAIGSIDMLRLIDVDQKKSHRHPAWSRSKKDAKSFQHFGAINQTGEVVKAGAMLQSLRTRHLLINGVMP